MEEYCLLVKFYNKKFEEGGIPVHPGRVPVGGTYCTCTNVLIHWSNVRVLHPLW